MFISSPQRDMAARMGSGAMRGGPPRGGDRGRRDGDYGMAPRGQMGMCAPAGPRFLLASDSVQP